MSDYKSDEEQQQQMKKIFICADVLLKIFGFLCPFDVGLKIALTNYRFNTLVDVHFKSGKWLLGSMEIRRATDENGAEIVNARSGEGLPISQGSLPDKVIGFKSIVISYVDQTVIEFLQRIRPLSNSSGANVWIDNCDQSRSWEIIRQEIWPLVADNIRGLRLDPSVLGRLRQFSPAILRNCATLQSIYSLGLFPEFPAEDDAAASSRQALAKWLLTPCGDGLPKMFHCDLYLGGIDELIESFADASESANFIIKIWKDGRRFVPFELKNNWTREQLSFRRLNNKWLLVRCPIEREEDKWAKWEKEAIEWEMGRQSNCIVITDIGDGMDAANEGPNELNE
uniref:F-box domain-containing protein n=1 Tax=Globodera rostochiensis TaxID=31243 RepID=A0A914GS42_GLORO